jgi:hypothetical protein
MLFTLYERNIIWPLLHYWGFFTNYLELPKVGSVKFSFRVSRKEFSFILTFLVFFFRCFFLNQKVTFKVNYSNLFFEIIVKKKDNDFFFFFLLINLLANYLVDIVNLKKKNTSIGKKNQSVVVLSTSKFFLCIHEIFNIGFLYFPNNDFMYHVYNLFQNIFYSTKSIPLNLNIFINFNINNKFNYINKKILSFYSLNKN